MDSTWRKHLALFGVNTKTIAILIVLGKIVRLFVFLIIALGALLVTRSFLLFIKGDSDPRLADWLMPDGVIKVVPPVIFLLVLLFLLSLRNRR
jgi:hypothetical protein